MVEFQGRSDFCGHEEAADAERKLVTNFLARQELDVVVWRDAFISLSGPIFCRFLFGDPIESEIINVYMRIMQKQSLQHGFEIYCRDTFVQKEVLMKLKQHGRRMMVQRADYGAFHALMTSFTMIRLQELSEELLRRCRYIIFPLNDRKQWPTKFSVKLWIQLLLLSFGGVTVFQSLFMKGVSLTSPAMATAMPNLAPGLIFCIAWAFRLEKIELASIYSRAKIAGTLLCVVGALLMSLMQSTVQHLSAKEAQVLNSSPPPDNISKEQQTMIGCMYLIAAIFVLSSQIVLQATTLSDFPAPISLCALTSLIGVVLTTMVQMIEDDGWDTGWPLLTIQQLIVYSILAGSVSGICVSFNAWAMKKRGPVMVSIFNPLATVITVILSVITLGESISIGSLAGMCLMFTGLYFVLWAKGKEGFSINDDNNSVERM